jgi:hypothetical protein
MTDKKETKDVNYISFEGKDYDFDKLSEKAKYYVKQMGFLQEEMAELQAAVERSKMALDGYSSLLQTEVSN